MLTYKSLIGLGLLTACWLAAGTSEGPHCREADRLIREFAQKVQEEHGLSLTGFGGEMHHEIRTLGLSFSSRNSMELKEARALYLGLVQEFVDTVNRDRLIRPYLSEYPISTKQVEILLSLQDDQGKMRRDGSVCMILNVPEVNKVLYHRFDLDRVVSTSDEPLEEALASRAL